jgi:hypothetical protein
VQDFLEEMSEATLVINKINSLIPPSDCLIQENVEMPKETLESLGADEVPRWLTEEFAENVLKSSMNDSSIKVDKLIVRPCAAKGDNYASVMYRATAYYRSKTSQLKPYSLVIKSMIDSEFALERLGPKNYDVQSKEMDMYSKVIPEFKSLLKSVNENSNIFPEILAVDKTNNVIVMEDLVERNFIMQSRIERLDSVHVKMALQKLAHFHACSLIMIEKDPNVFKQFDTGEQLTFLKLS